MRAVALLLLFAVLPTAELTEQVAHVVEHLIHHDADSTHSAHHDAMPGDEHGCTGLIHLCGHHTQVTASMMTVVAGTIETPDLLPAAVPDVLVDLNSLEPPHRPPIA